MMHYRFSATVLFIGLSTFLVGFLQKPEITIFLAGDSTMADKPYGDGNPEKGWGQVLSLYFKEGIRVENHAVNGRSTKSFRDEGRWDAILDRMKPRDYVIIEFGHNDQKIDDSTRYSKAGIAYKQNLIMFIKEARKAGGTPVLATPIVRRRFNESGKFFDTHGDYPGAVREVAKKYDVTLLDLHALSKELLIKYGEEGSKKLFLHLNPSEYESLPEGRKDDTHLSATGAFRICDLVKNEIVQKIPDLKSSFKL